MTKQEIEKAIESGESVFVVSLGNVWEIKPTIKDLQILPAFKDIYNTKAEAEHYLNHANITRTEQLPFLTWEEFLKNKSFMFTNYSDYYGIDTVNKMFSLELNVKGDEIILFSHEVIPLEEWEATEENFYKAYDECVRLFRGGE